MRRQRIPIGWPRRDPRRYRFALPNAIWEFKLKPIEFVIFSWLCYRNSHGQGSALTSKVVAKRVHLSENTAKKYLDSLVNRGLLTVEWSPTLDNQRINSKKFFTLPNELFLLNLSPSVFMVYAYLLLIENRRAHTCHPSYNTIAATTGMAKNTVMKSISVLQEMRLIAMEHSRYIDRRGMKWKGNNLYTIRPISEAVEIYHARQLEKIDAGNRQAESPGTGRKAGCRVHSARQWTKRVRLPVLTAVRRCVRLFLRG